MCSFMHVMNHHTFIFHCYHNLKEFDFNVKVKNDCYSKILDILFLNFILTSSFSLGKFYIARKIYLFSFHKKKNQFVISNFLEWDMCHLLNKCQAASSDEFFLFLHYKYKGMSMYWIIIHFYLLCLNFISFMPGL